MTVYPARIVRDVIDAIDNDSWMFICVWGNGRTGKSSFCMNLMYQIYHDWDMVLAANIFNLPQLLHNLDNGIPTRFPTLNKLHMRIPILNWDDYAADSGKAKTQHEKGWDIFKGAFDTLTTKIGVLMVNMVRPTSITQQLMEKYTHEVWIASKGCYKYDTVQTQQDYQGWRLKTNKEWIDESVFDPIPDDIYRQYDEIRVSLADEVLQSVKDTVVDTNIVRITQRINAEDLNLLSLIKEKGLVHIHAIENAEIPKRALVRCKSRGLVVATHVSQNYYKYDITDLGLEVLRTVNESEKIRKAAEAWTV